MDVNRVKFSIKKQNLKIPKYRQGSIKLARPDVPA